MRWLMYRYLAAWVEQGGPLGRCPPPLHCPCILMCAPLASRTGLSKERHETLVLPCEAEKRKSCSRPADVETLRHFPDLQRRFR